MQLVTYVQDIYDHASLHSKNKEEAASGASMLATPIYTVDSMQEWKCTSNEFLNCSKATQSTSKSFCYVGSDSCHMM